jgi:MFS family permease
MIAPPPEAAGSGDGTAAVLKNRPFLLLWLAQLTTQIGGNMVLYGLTVIVASATDSNTAVSLLILTFLVPAVLFSAVAGVYVDRLDRRLILVVTNVLRAIAFLAIFFVDDHLLAILLLNITVSTITVFFAPAEAAMIPFLVPRRQLIAANGIFTLTLNAAFALGFALMGPLIVTLLGAPALILLVASLYLVAAGFCWVLPAPPKPEATGVSASQAVHDAERAVQTTVKQLREGLGFIAANRGVSWSLIYLGVAASLVGVLGVLGPDFARTTLGLQPKDFVVVVLPLGVGIVMGILVLNSYGKYVPRRRVIEAGLIGLGVMLAALSIAGPISTFLRRAQADAPLGADLSAVTSLLAVVVAIAFLTGVAYAFVAIPAQTQLQEDLPEDVRGRVFGVLNMLVSIASFLPIIVVGPISDVIGTGTVILLVAIGIGLSGVASVIQRGPLRLSESMATAGRMVPGVAVEPIGVVTHADPAALPPSEADDDGVAPWMRAAGWGKAARRAAPQAADSEVDAAPAPSEVAAADPAAQAPHLAAADPLGLAPDDPEALARAQTEALELPWSGDPQHDGRDATSEPRDQTLPPRGG